MTASSDKSSPYFWERHGNAVTYPQLRQTRDTCVFVSIAAAVNHLCGRQVWTEQSLYDEFVRQGNGGVTFNVAKHAVSPVSDEVEHSEHLDSNGSPPPSNDDLSAWVADGGVVIVSLEKAKAAGSQMQRCGRWHMFALVAKDGDYFQVWDTNGRGGFIHESELESGIDYGGGVWFVVHDRHNMLFLRRKQK